MYKKAEASFWTAEEDFVTEIGDNREVHSIFLILPSAHPHPIDIPFAFLPPYPLPTPSISRSRATAKIIQNTNPTDVTTNSDKPDPFKTRDIDFDQDENIQRIRRRANTLYVYGDSYRHPIMTMILTLF